MTAEATTPPATSSVVQMPLARLRAHPRNVRTSLGDLRDLTGSIRQLGVLQPLVVERRGEVFQILAGHRRAGLSAGRPPRRCATSSAAASPRSPSSSASPSLLGVWTPGGAG